MKTFYPIRLAIIAISCFFLSTTLQAQISVTATGGTTTGTYSSLKTAFDAINAGTHQGAIALKVTDNLIERASCVLNASGTGSASYSSVLVYPDVAGITISCNLAAPLIDLNGATNVTIDGRVKATGTVPDMTLINSSSSNVLGTSTIRFTNDASYNTLKYCTVKGAQASSNCGIIYLTVPKVTGNNNNTIDHNNITTVDNINRTSCAIMSYYGSASGFAGNNNTTISNNTIYNFLKPSLGSTGISLYYTSNTTISGNSFYETTAFAPNSGSSYYMIYSYQSTNATLSGNYMGGSAPQCGGAAFTKTNTNDNPFECIYVNGTATSQNNIQGNTIQNFNWANSSSSAWTGIDVVGSGSANIGTVTGNLIGAATGTGNIQFTGSNASITFKAIAFSTSGNVGCSNNTIGAITVTNATTTAATNFYGIHRVSGAGTAIITNNIIGSLTTANSINASSVSTATAQVVYGISDNGSGASTLNNNTVANLTNGTTDTSSSDAGTIMGIYSVSSGCYINNNTINNLTIGNAYSTSPCAVGIYAPGIATVNNNTINNISNTYSSFGGTIVGIYQNGNNSWESTMSGNFISNLSVNINSTGATLCGIKLGDARVTISNNVISLSSTARAYVYGTWEKPGSLSSVYRILYNTVYIGGVISTGNSCNSAALYSETSGATRMIENNVFYNARSNAAGGGGEHYAVYFNSYTNTNNLTLNYNDYYVTGTGAKFGFYNSADVAAKPLVSGVTDANSMAINPGLTTPGGTSVADYATATALNGLAINQVQNDINNYVRSAGTPRMGAIETTTAPPTTVDAYTDGTLSASYANLNAAFAALNAGSLHGNVALRINADQTVTSTAVLFTLPTGTTVSIYPTVSGLTISANLSAPLILLNGASNVVIDGRVNATGSVPSLVIANTSTSNTIGTSTLKFDNGASNNVIKYCTLKGSTLSSYDGVITLGTNTNGSGNNNNNVFDHNNITSCSDANRPLYTVRAEGYSATATNDNNTFSNNNVYNFLNPGQGSFGILVWSYNSNLTISGNSFYETTAFTATTSGSYTIINMNATGTSTVSGNYIGGSAPNCGGTAWVKTGNNNEFRGINTSIATGSVCDVQGNTIANINYTNSSSASFYGIYTNNAGGTVNIGTTQANVIGAGTGTGSISYTSAYGFFYGIWLSSTGVCNNNIIGSVNGLGSTYLYGIYSTGGSQIAYNSVGSATTANSILSATITVTGIQVSNSTAINVTGNTVSNICNNGTSPTSTVGMVINSISSSMVNNNIVHDITSMSSQAGLGYGARGISASTVPVSGNTVYNLINNSATTGTVCGISLSGSNASNNFIYGLSAPNGTTPNLYGIYKSAGTSTIANNIVNIGSGVNTNAGIYGIADYSTASGQNSNVYFNTVYISGAPTTGTSASYGLYSNALVATYDYRNNLLFNARSNNGATGNHYAAYYNYSTTAGLTNNYNNYYVSGTGGVLAYYGADKITLTALQTATTQDVNSINTNPGLTTAGGTQVANYTASTAGIAATGTGILSDATGTIRNATSPTIGALDQPTVTATVDAYQNGTYSKSYLNLNDALVDVNAGTLTGNVTLKLKASQTLISSLPLNRNTSYSSLTIYPTVGGLSITGNISGAPLIDLNGAQHVTLDGRVNGTGTAADLSIINQNTSTTTGTSTVRFINDAQNNTVKYCTIKGSSASTTDGIITFGVAATGNNNNTVDNNTITNVADANRPYYAIYSQGANSNNSISNNAIYNFLNPGLPSYGVYLTSNNNGWTISGNSFYETTSFVPTAAVAYNVIYIANTGTNYSISGNSIGGSAPLCGGTPWTKTAAFQNNFSAINLNQTATSGIAASIDGNTIKNFDYSDAGNNLGSWSGILLAGTGNVNIGTTTGNVIGAATGTGAITYTGAYNTSRIYGINVTTTGNVNCNNNTIGSITGINTVSTNAVEIYGIVKSSNGGTFTVQNNTIGSTTTANSMNATSTSTAQGQIVYGIFSNSGSSSTYTISGNVVANLTNACTYVNSSLSGIYISAGMRITVSNNSVHDLTTANNPTTYYLYGINTYGGAAIISGNTVYNLICTNSAFTGEIDGIYCFAPSAVNNNYVYGLDAPTSTTVGTLKGINTQGLSGTVANNIVNLGNNHIGTLYGMYFQCGTGTAIKMYYNTVYMGGSPTTLASGSNCIYYSGTADSWDIRNNVFRNARYNSGAATGSHSIGALPGPIDYNDYSVSGLSGSVTYSLVSESNSVTIDPAFANAGGTLTTDYRPSNAFLLGTPLSTVTTDYAGTTRSTTTPAMGAYELVVQPGIITLTATAGSTTGSYTTLKTAFDAINAGTHQGDIRLKINESTTETTQASLNANGTGGSNYNSVLIYPTVSGKTISGNYAGNLINLNGATNVTFDGRLNATGTTSDLSIVNSSTSGSASTLVFQGNANANTIQYCSLKGSGASILNFSSSTASVGNSNNSISNNNITNAGGNRPFSVIMSSGSTYNNSNNKLINNNIYDVIAVGASACNVINLQGYNTAWTISGNSFYETSSVVPTGTGAINIIYINAGANYTISGNYIGGSAPLCGGSPWTKTNVKDNTFTGIFLNASIYTQSNTIQGNIIKNLAYANAAAGTWTGIQASGVVVVSGNTIGASTGTGSIAYTAEGGTFNGIYFGSAYAATCAYNKVGSVTVNNVTATGATNFYGINSSSPAAISNNTIGSNSTANSVNLTSTATGVAQTLYGISNTSLNTITISGNTIANLTNGTTSLGGGLTGTIQGIRTTGGGNTISNNSVHDLKISNFNPQTGNNASAIGISLNVSTAVPQSVTGNSVYNISNTVPTGYASYVDGIYYSGPTTACVVSGNFIYGVSASSASVNICGLNTSGGTATYANNIINLSSNIASQPIYGIYENNVDKGNFFFNTVSLSGTSTGGYALYSSTPNNSVYKNNILYNSKSNGYAIYPTSIVGLTFDYNDYYAPNGYIGYAYSVNRTTLAQWKTATSQDVNSLSVDPQFAVPGGTMPLNYFSSAVLPAVAGLGINVDFNNQLRNASSPQMGAVEAASVANTVGLYTGSTLQASYPDIRAAFDAINSGMYTGDIVLKMNGSQVLNSSAILNAGGTAGAGYSSVLVYPTATGITISGNVASPLIDLNNAGNVTIDGRVNATGSSTDLTIVNNSTSSVTATSTIRLVNGASGNTIQYCTLKGSTTSTAGGVVFFDASNTGVGNNNNLITRNNITGVSASARPLAAIYSLGTAVGIENSNNTISNNNIYNWMSPVGTSSYGIMLAANNTAWTIAGNSLYETAALTPTASVSYFPVYISNTGVNYNVTANYIGGSAPMCGASAWTKTNALNNLFTGITLSCGTAITSSVQGNIIRNMNWTSTINDTFTGINVTVGNVNVGTVTGNIIGDATGTGSISFTSGSGTPTHYGINLTVTSGVIDCRNNTIGSITLASSDATKGVTFYGIKTGNFGTGTYANNTIGSLTTANSINLPSASTGSVQSLVAMNICPTVSTISGNTIANLTNGTTNSTTTFAGTVLGILMNYGSATITNNTINKLTIANANTGIDASVSVAGILLSSTGANPQVVMGNTISNLSNSYPTFTGSIYGIYYNGSTTASSVANNFVYGLSASDASSIAANIYGLYIKAGLTTYFNNLISLGGDFSSAYYGIYENGATTSNNNNLYYNTVYLYGNKATGASNSYALYSNAKDNIRNIRNNVFNNSRQTTGGTGSNYAAYFNYAVNTNLTLNYNDYYAPGTNGVLGYYAGAPVTSIPLIATMDVNSTVVDPAFAIPGGITIPSYYPSASLIAVTGTGVGLDMQDNARDASTPKMGALEAANAASMVEVYTGGSLQASYSSIKTAFDAINNGVHTGDITLKVKASHALTSTAVLNASGAGNASYSSIVIYPTQSGISISGNLAAPLIDLNRASHVTIDGRVNATGTIKDMILINNNTLATAGISTIRFVNGASNNTINYCVLKGATKATVGGVVFFDVTSNLTGNKSNLIDNNSITNVDNTNRPINAIYSAGYGVGTENTNTISNNNIFDFMDPGNASYGINLAANNTAWTISGNSFYETTTFVPTATVNFNVVYLNNAGANYNITGNFIGGSSASCGGAAWTKTNAYNNQFYGINIAAAGITAASNIQGNTITNFNYSNSVGAGFYGINVKNGLVNIGTVTGNVMGASTGTGSITCTYATFYGIYLDGAAGSMTDCRNNVIGAITTTNTATFASSFYGIYKSATAGNVTINNNVIGSTTTANSVNTTSTASSNAQYAYGIYTLGTGSTGISGNTIANLTNGATGTSSLVQGINIQGGTNTITNNTIRNLTTASANTGTDINTSVAGIVYKNSSSFTQTISGNTIYSLSNSHPTAGIWLSGIYYYGAPSSVSNNLIYDLTVASTGTTYTTGIYIGYSDITCVNNIVTLGGNTQTVLSGILLNNTGKYWVYHNTVYLGGSLASGVLAKSYALYISSNTQTRDIRNNLLYNARSTVNGANLHYALFTVLTANTGLTLDNNDYYVTGTGGVLGYYNNANVTSPPLIAGMDANSLSADPKLANPGGTSYPDYYPNAPIISNAVIASVPTDYTGNAHVANMVGALDKLIAPDGLTYPSSPVVATLGVAISNANPVSTGGGITGYTINTPLPAGLNLNGTTGVISGAATVTSPQTTYTVTGTNSLGSTTASFVLTVHDQMFAVSFSSPSHGTLTVKNGAATVSSGDLIEKNTVLTVTAIPDAGYVLSSFKANGSDIVRNSVTVTSATNIVAAFAIPVWTGATSTDWNTATNWTPNVVPTSLVDIVVGSATNAPTVGDNSVCNNLTVNTGGVITIPAGKSLTVAGSITNSAGAAGIVIKSDAVLPTGTLIYHNAQNAPVQATVEMYSKASWNLTNTTGNKYKWQFFGIPVRTSVVSPTLDAALVRRYDELQVTNNWFALNASSTLDPFTGYEIVQEAAKKYSYTGDLVNADYSQTLTKTSGAVNAGNHLFANPYTAAIDITKLNFGIQTDATVYLYNTGTVNEWATNSGSTVGANPGQYTAAPKANAGVGGIPAQVPSMQGFVVKALSNDANATFGIPYSAVVVKNADQQRVKSMNASSDKVYTIVDVVGATGGDRMWLFTDASCSHSFDNGWDGRKMLGSALVPQLYASEADGDYQVNSVNDVNNTDLAFQAGTDSNYKLRFTHNNVQTVYDKLYLLDNVTGTTTDITASGTEYSFTAGTGVTPTNRFKIVATIGSITGVNTPTEEAKITVFSSKNTIFVQNNTSDKGDLMLYDIAGRFIEKLPFSASAITSMHMGLVPGVYVAKAMINNKVMVTNNLIIQ